MKKLKLSEYKGTSEEVNTDKSNLVTLSELFKSILASDEETKKFMNQNNIIEINGYVRLLSNSAIYEASGQVIDYIIENNFDYKHIKEEDLRNIELDGILLVHVLNKLGIKNNDHWELNRNNIAKITAHLIFHSQHPITKVLLFFIIFIIFLLSF